MGMYKRLGKNIILQFIGSFSSKLLSFFLVPLYTSVLSTEEYGVADYVNVTINLLYPILTMVIVEAEVRFALDPKEDKKQIYTFSNIIGLLAIVAALAIAPLLMLNSILEEWYLYLILGLISWIVYEILLHFALGLDRVSTASSAGVVNTFATIIFTIISLVVFDLGIPGYLLSSTLGNVVAAIYIFIRERCYIYYTQRIENDLKKRMLKYSIPMIPNSIAWWLNNSADKYMVEYFHGASTMALLSVAYRIPSVLTTVISIFVSAWRLSSVDKFGSEENKTFFRNIYKLFNLVLSLTTIVCLIFTQELSRFLFQSDFFEAWTIVPFLLVAYVFQGESTFLGSVFTADKKTNVLLISTIAGSLVNVVLNYFLIPVYGNAGAAFATLCGYFVICLTRYIYALKIMPLSVHMKDEGISILIIILISVVSYQIFWVRLLSCAVGVLCIIFIQKRAVLFMIEQLKRVVKQIRAK